MQHVLFLLHVEHKMHSESASCARAEIPTKSDPRFESGFLDSDVYWIAHTMLWTHFLVSVAHHRRTCLTACGRRQILARRCLRSADTTTLQVPSTRRATLGDRAFPVAAARAWSSLPLETRACSSLLTFQRETKSHLFRQSYG